MSEIVCAAKFQKEAKKLSFPQRIAGSMLHFNCFAAAIAIAIVRWVDWFLCKSILTWNCSFSRYQFVHHLKRLHLSTVRPSRPNSMLFHTWVVNVLLTFVQIVYRLKMTTHIWIEGMASQRERGTVTQTFCPWIGRTCTTLPHRF